MITFVTATRENVTDVAAFAHKHVPDANKYGYYIFPNNAISLSKCYNDFIRFQLNKAYPGDILVFMHDDVIIEDSDFEFKLKEAMCTFDIVGLAGTNHFQISEYSMWHHCPPSARSGAVTHPAYVNPTENDEIRHYLDTPQVGVASFGPMPQECVVLDGLFLAVDINTVLLSGGIRFDKELNWHFYDLDFCLTAHEEEALSIGTWPIHARHISPGLRSFDDPIFLKDRDRFNRTWGPKGKIYSLKGRNRGFSL